MKRKVLKRALAMCVAFVITATVFVNNCNNLKYAVPTSATYQDEIDENKKRLEELQNQQAQIDQQLQQNKENYENELEYQEELSTQIATVEETLGVLSNYILELNKDILDCEEDIAEKESQIATKETQIEEGTDAFLQRLRAMYVAGDDTYASVLIGSTDFYDMLMKIELVKRVASYDKQIIDELYDLKKQLEAEKIALDEKKAELEVQKAEYDEQKTLQEEQRLKLQDLYSESEIKADQFKNDFDLSQEEHDKLHSEMLDLEGEIADLVAKEEARKKEEEKRKQELLQQQQQQNNNSGSSNSNAGTSGTYTGDTYHTGTGAFAWPVPGYYHITSYVGWRWGAYHQGIDISSAGIRGANIVASDSGTVVKVNNSCTHDYGKSGSCGCGGGYGNYCIVNHGNGYMTLYGHAQYISVSVGQEVNQGDVLGIVGTTGFSTGDHLHFEVRKNGVAVNPMDYV